MDRYKASTLKAFDTKWPDRYDTSWWVDFWVGRWDQEVLAELPPHLDRLRILDVGCATGRLLACLGNTGVRDLAGVDLAPRIVACAERQLAQMGLTADLKVADAEVSLPWPSQSFNVVTMTGVLHHFPHPTDALKEVHRIMRPAATLILIDPWFPPPVRQLINLYLRITPRDGDFRFWSPTEVTRLLALHNLNVSRQRRAPWHSFLIVATRID